MLLAAVCGVALCIHAFVAYYREYRETHNKFPRLYEPDATPEFTASLEKLIRRVFTALYSTCAVVATIAVSPYLHGVTGVFAWVAVVCLFMLCMKPLLSLWIAWLKYLVTNPYKQTQGLEKQVRLTSAVIIGICAVACFVMVIVMLAD